MWMVPKNVIPGGQQIVGFNQLGKKRVSSHEGRYFQVIRKKKKRRKDVKVPSFCLSSHQGEQPKSRSMGYPGFRGCGKSRHLDFSSPSRGSPINRLILDTRRLPAKQEWGLGCRSLCPLFLYSSQRHSCKPLVQANQVLHGPVATATPPSRPSLSTLVAHVPV